jgi:hypothetical protein
MTIRKRTELACLWCLVPALLLITVGWIASGYFPPPSPAMSARGYQSFFIDHAGGMRVAVTLLGFGGTLTVPFVVAVTTQMLRIEGPRGPLAYTQLAMGAITVVTFMAPLFPLIAGAYRPHSDPSLIRTLSDMFWLPYVMAIWPSAGQAVAMGALALRRSAANPLPRWYGYSCLGLVIGMLPSALVLSRATGPLGSRGVVGLWLPALSVYAWYVLSMLVFHRAISASDEPETDQTDEAFGVTRESLPATPQHAAVS